MADHEILWFGNFEFDLRTRRLTKHGYRVKLQPKSALLLSFLIERAGKVASRDDLKNVLWPNQLYVDFETGIKVAVKKLRDALGDNSDDPTFIQTIPGEGYRFIGLLLDRNRGNTPSPEIVVTEVDSGTRKLTADRWLWGAVVMMALVTATLALSVHSAASDLLFRGRDWVLIAAFENNSGDRLLDGSVEYALERELGRSDYVNVVPPDRVRDALTLMRQNPLSVLTSELARQVALRDGGVKAILTGQIRRAGNGRMIIVQIVDPATGRPVVTVEEEAEPTQITAAADALAGRIRQILGEHPQDTRVPEHLEKATTQSLPALQAFSRGYKAYYSGQSAAAAGFFEEAVHRDSSFALAHLYAAYAYSNLKREDLAGPHYRASVANPDGLTDRERLLIMGSYYDRLLHDPHRAIPEFEALLTEYPDDISALWNLLRVEEQIGSLPDAIRTREALIRMYPTATFRAYGDIYEVWCYYRRNEPNESKAAYYAQLLQERLHLSALNANDTTVYHFSLTIQTVSDLWFRNDVAGTAREVDRLTQAVLSSPAAKEDIFHVAMIDLVLGRLHAAKQLCEQVPDRISRTECDLRTAYLMDDYASASRLLLELRKIDPPYAGLGGDSLIAYWLHDTDAVRRWLPAAYAPFLIALKPGRSRAALEGLRKLPGLLPGVFGTNSEVPGPSYFNLWYHLTIALTLEQQHDLNGAISELEWDTRPAIVNVRQGWPWSKCRLELMRLYQEAGRAADARRVADEIRFYLSAADSDNPTLSKLRR
jgi:DNA-binding winged helix-turn-helix (wHTH) protein